MILFKRDSIPVHFYIYYHSRSDFNTAYIHTLLAWFSFRSYIYRGSSSLRPNKFTITFFSSYVHMYVNPSLFDFSLLHTYKCEHLSVWFQFTPYIFMWHLSVWFQFTSYVYIWTSLCLILVHFIHIYVIIF